MLRCDKPVGNYHVEFFYVDSEGNEDNSVGHNVPIGNHENTYEVVDGGRDLKERAPYVSHKIPFDGALCEHEVAFLKSLPGKVFNGHWRFSFSAVK